MAVKSMSNGGDTAAILQMQALSQLASSFQGGYLEGRKREDGKLTNADVVEYLAEGGRDISATDEDSDDGARLMRDRYEERLLVLSQKKVPLKKGASGIKGAVSGLTENKMNDSAAASGIRAAIKLVQSRLAERVEAGVDREGQRKPVTPAYATWRQGKYNVAIGEILKASGQLLNNLKAGRIVLSKGATIKTLLGL
jgi:hypothetical protein